ncbi:sodium/solute symporter [Membranihabitans marinus]
MTEIPDNPALIQQSEKQPGLAGGFAGMSNGALLIAGGANFPYGLPWEGGQKKWWSDVYVMVDHGNDSVTWIENSVKLPVAAGYGLSIPWDNGILCIGGNNEQGIVSQVIGLVYNPETQSISIEEYPSLPDDFEAVSGDICNGQILVHGINKGKNQLLRREVDGSWTYLAPCPGPSRGFALSVSQNDGIRDNFYVLSGRSTTSEGEIVLLKDGYRYDIIEDRWYSIGDIALSDSESICVMAGTAIPVGSSHIFVLGGDDGEQLLERAALEKKISSESIDTIQRELDKKHLADLFRSHNGFSNRILSFHTITNTWTVVDTFPSLLPVTTQIVSRGDDWLITSGEIKPGIRSPKIWVGSPEVKEYHFGFLNIMVVILYLLAMIWIGVKYSRRQNSTDDYFKGGGRIPWWAAGLSLFGTSLSAITFMAIPAKTYMTDWSYFFFQMTPLLTAPLLIALYIPYYRRLNITTAYEFLESRFNLLTRLLGSISFMILQLGRVGIVLFLPSIAIHLVTGISIDLCILVMGVISIVYTMLGGIEAVIWTDVLQVIVLMGGALLCVVVLYLQLDQGPMETIQMGIENHKFNLLDTAFDLKRPTIYVVLLGGIFANLITSGSDQTMVQRYLTTPTESGAKKSVWTFALLGIPATLLFFSIGTLLFLYFKANPTDLNPAISNEDAIFPWYIVSQLPAGISGLLIAGIFSAAMSSLSSSMNSVATAFMTDFYHRFSWGSNTSALKMARISTLIFGILGTGFALLMSRMEIQSLWDQFQLYIGLFAGGLGGLFLLGIVTKRANGNGAVIGLIASGIIQYFLTQNTDLHVLLYAGTGFVSCFVIAYVASLIWRDPGDKTLN